MSPFDPEPQLPEHVVADAMRRAVVAAGLPYHDPIARSAAERALCPCVRWACEGRVAHVSGRPVDHARLTDAGRVTIWRWLLGPERPQRQAAPVADAMRGGDPPQEKAAPE